MATGVGKTQAVKSVGNNISSEKLTKTRAVGTGAGKSASDLRRGILCVNHGDIPFKEMPSENGNENLIPLEVKLQFMIN